MSDYTVSSYGGMIVDQARMVPFVEALRRHVTVESVVFDIGAGAGIFALLACQFGARKVYAIEPNNAILTAQALAAANGFSDRLICIQDLSTKITLPEQADIYHFRHARYVAVI